MFIGTHYLIRFYGRFELLMQISETWNNFGKLPYFNFLVKFLYLSIFADNRTFNKILDRDYLIVS